jgi:hypothetical protein
MRPAGVEQVMGYMRDYAQYCRRDVPAAAEKPSRAGPFEGWKLEGRFVPEQAVYDAKCAATLDDLCRAFSADEELSVRNGELTRWCDGECCPQPFRADRIERDRAEGSFERRDFDGPPGRPPCSGASCDGRLVQIWREGDELVLRGALDSLGFCARPEGTETTLLRFVPRARLQAAAEAQAPRLGVSLRRCNFKTLPGAGPPRPCWTGDGKR